MAGSRAVSVESLGAAVAAIAEEKAAKIGPATRRAVTAAADASLDYLRKTRVPDRRSGEYAAGWKKKVEGNDAYGYTAYVYQAEKPSLTHLLELGHGLVWMGHPTGRTVPPFPHIEIAGEIGANELMKEVG